MRPSRSFLMAGFLGFLLAIPASAQIASLQEPSATTATYGSWQVRCSRQKDAAVCEMVQSFTAGNDRKIIAQLAIGQLPRTATPRAVLQVPLGVDLTQPPVLILGDRAKYIGRYIICVGRFCRAEIELPKNAVEEIAKVKKASVSFTLWGKAVVAPVTTEGMAVAFGKAIQNK